MPYKDPETRKVKQAENNHRWYLKNQKRLIQKAATAKKRTRELFIEFKKTLVCCECGENRAACIEFHHVNGRDKIEGKSDRSSLSRYYCCRKKLEEELEKCLPVCANCHNLVHAGEIELNVSECSKDWRKTLQKFLGWFDSSRSCQTID